MDNFEIVDYSNDESDKSSDDSSENSYSDYKDSKYLYMKIDNLEKKKLLFKSKSKIIRK